MRLITFLILLVTMIFKPVYANETDDKYKYCALAGFFYGAKDEFYAGLAVRLIDQSVFGKPVCTAVHKDAYATGEYLSQGKPLQQISDGLILQEASAFKKKIQDSILSGAGLK